MEILALIIKIVLVVFSGFLIVVVLLQSGAKTACPVPLVAVRKQCGERKGAWHGSDLGAAYKNRSNRLHGTRGSACHHAKVLDVGG